MNIENLKVGNTYIIKGKNAHNDKTVYKITVKEITQETLLLYYEDSGNTNRCLKSEFDYQWKIIEDMGNVLEEQLKRGLIEMQKQPMEFISLPTCNNKICYCDGSCNKQLQRIMFNQNWSSK